MQLAVAGIVLMQCSCILHWIESSKNTFEDLYILACVDLAKAPKAQKSTLLTPCINLVCWY